LQISKLTKVYGRFLIPNIYAIKGSKGSKGAF